MTMCWDKPHPYFEGNPSDHNQSQEQERIKDLH